MTDPDPRDDIVKMRTSFGSYVVLWIPLLALAVVFGAVGCRGQQDAWLVSLFLVLMGGVGSTALLRKRVSLFSAYIEYRSLLGLRAIPIHKIKSIKGISVGREGHGLSVRGPGLYLIVETIESKKQIIAVSLKYFRRSDMKRFFEVAASRNLPVYMNEIVKALIYG